MDILKAFLPGGIRNETHWHGEVDHWHADNTPSPVGHVHIESPSDPLHMPSKDHSTPFERMPTVRKVNF